MLDQPAFWLHAAIHAQNAENDALIRKVNDRDGFESKVVTLLVHIATHL